jgi:aryl-alcohol dehydrogenase (NADP+)
VAAAIERDITFFDTGPTYGGGEAEQLLGRALQESGRRSECIVATKVFFPTGPGLNDRGLSRRHIFASVERSLERLQREWIDLLYMHRWDHETPIDETLRALEDLVRAGKVRYLGASSMSAWRFMKALMLQRQNAWSRFVAMQSYYNLIYREEERETLPLCSEEGVGVLPWSPLARGLLADDSDSGRREGDALVNARLDGRLDMPVIEDLHAVAVRRGCSRATVALAWLLGRPGVVAPVIGIGAVDQLDTAVAATRLSLTLKETRDLEASYRPHAIVGFEPEARRE